MLVSVIVPVYNVEKYVSQCLESISSQTYGDIEIIVVNDGSTDGSLKICKGYAAKDKRINLISKENGGLVSAWKAGLAVVSGEYIAFVDSDDFIAPDYIACLIARVKDDIDMVCMNCTRYEDNGKEERLKINALKEGEYLLDGEFYDNFIIGKYRQQYVANSRWAKLVKTSIAKTCAAYCSEEVSMGEDQQFTVGALLESKKIVMLDEYKYFYRFNPSSIVNSYKKNLWERSKLLIDAIASIPKAKTVPGIDDQLKLQLLLYLFECLKNEQFYGNGLTKEYFLRLIDEAYKEKLYFVRGKKLVGAMSKILYRTTKKRSYAGTKLALRMYGFMKRI